MVENELRAMFESDRFTNAPIVRAFLNYVVQEHLAGRSDQIKAYNIATAAFGRGADFDPTTDTIVRTTAGRLRNALKAYYDEHAGTPGVVIDLPKGTYVPSFEFPEAPEAAGVTQRHGFSPSRWRASNRGLTITCGILAMIMVALVAIFFWRSNDGPVARNLVIHVQPVNSAGPKTQALARAIDLELSPALSRIRLARIIPPLKSPGTAETHPNADPNDFVFTLRTSLTRESPPALHWQLIDSSSNFLVWASKEPLTKTDPASLDRVISKVAFQILGENGAVPMTLERYHGELFSNQACVSRAQLMRAVENSTIYPEMRACLEHTVSRHPNDASAWAILSTFYSVRTRYYKADEPAERTKILELASQAAARAGELAPQAYLTKVAFMQLALSQNRVGAFDELQEYIRTMYPGNIYLEMRIASRLTRLGRGSEALQIFDDARENWGINLRGLHAELALAHFVEGDYEQAYRLMARPTSDQLYVLLLKAAAMGKMGMKEEAAPVVNRLVSTYPDIRERFYPWLSGLNWCDPLLAELADGLATAGLIVETDQLESRMNETL